MYGLKKYRIFAFHFSQRLHKRLWLKVFDFLKLLLHKYPMILLFNNVHTTIHRLSCLLIFGLFLYAPKVHAQVSDFFSDGNFTNNPTWSGNNTDWIVNTDQQLQSNSTTASSNFYLSTTNTKATDTQWDFWVRLAFNPSGVNYADVYITASQSNITLSNTTGYFVRLGDTPDEISLYRKDATGNAVKIIDGIDGILNSSNNVVRVRVTRNVANVWTLGRDLGSTGAFIPEGTATDATHTTSAFFGIWVRQSTATFFQRLYFDDIEVKDFIPDFTPPSVTSTNAISANTLDVLFSEALNNATAINQANYTANNGIGNPTTVIPDATNPLQMRLTFATPFPNGTTCTLTVNNVRDVAGNVLNNGTSSFAFYTARRYDIVLHEIMVDPTPQVGLPNANWIEIRNTSAFAINLQGYRLGRAAGLSGPLPAYFISPGQFIILCTGLQVPVLSPFGTTLAVTSFSTLPNTGELIWLQDAEGRIMHSVAYNQSWYQNDVKAQGGWTLEMIDAANPCAGSSNWRASTNASGGTPGRANSIAGTNRDQTAPQLLQAFAPDANTMVLTFNEPLDSSLSAAANFSISNAIGTPIAVSVNAPQFTTVELRFANALQAGTIYTVTATNVRDCAGNAIGNLNTAKTGLAFSPDSLDLIINEILFNPKPLGVDYLEIYNRSNKILNASNIYFTNRSSSSGALGTLYPLSANNRLIFPGEFYAVTENVDLIKQGYNVQNPDALAQVTAMPSFPDDKGTVVLLNQTGRITDELNYDQRWHFALIDNNEGISLERIDYNRRTQLADNWTSAAQSAGFGTPGYQNSQYRKEVTAPAGSITINPVMFSPDNDGFEDFTLIEFAFNEPGYVANVTIMDAAGRPVRVLQRNNTIAASGSFRWDGLNDKQQRVASGIYIIFFEAFNLAGKKQVFKKGVTVARKF